MGQKLFKLPSKCLWISWICWFDIVRNMWGFLATSHARTTAKDNLSNKPQFVLGLLSNLEYLLRAVDTRSIILGFFNLVLYYGYPFYLSWVGIPLGLLDDCWAKTNLFNFDVLKNPSETVRLWYSEADAPLLTGLCCTCGSDCGWLLFSGAMLGLCLEFYEILLKIWSEPSIIEVNIIRWTDLWSTLHKICTIWGNCAIPN